MKTTFTLLCSIIFISNIATAGTIGDVTGDGTVGLPEAVHALQVTSGMKTTFTTASELTPFSAYIVCAPNDSEPLKNIATVPNDKTLIITDILHFIYSTNTVQYALENDSIKLQPSINLSSSSTEPYITLASGIPFAPGSLVNLLCLNPSSFNGRIFFSGYYIQNVVSPSATTE